ncbi:MAG TPA: hypothetical protein VM689_08885 [Aliidongia sp.]|nr:hypothetical protein [Aliidongia sp.]
MRPESRQYFLESDTDGTPFHRKPGELLAGTDDAPFAEAWARARAERFAPSLA